MRPSRSEILPPDKGQVHLIWKAHNSEFLLEEEDTKKLLFKSMIYGLKHQSVDGSVKLHAFCIMDNHSHCQVGYENGLDKLSSYMRVSHGVFGQRFNEIKERTGKVANERPKTPLIQDDDAQMRVHIYVETNPLRTKAIPLEKLRLLKWSSYRYFAFGIVDEYTKHIVDPEWYINLGKTPENRQRAYRKIVRKSLDAEGGGLHEQTLKMFRLFIGSDFWILQRKLELRDIRLSKRKAIAQESPKTET